MSGNRSRRALVANSRSFTRRDFVKAGGALAATSLWLPAGLIREARAQSAGFDFYISPRGTGSASAGGTLSDPWPLAMLNNSTARSRYAGKVVGLLDGTYYILRQGYNPTVDHISDQSNIIRVAGGASETQRTIIRAVNPRQAVIHGQTDEWPENRERPGMIGPLGSYVTFDGLKFTNIFYRAITVDGAGEGGVKHFFTVKNCHFFDQRYWHSVAGSSANAAFLFVAGRYIAGSTPDSDRSKGFLCQNCRFELGSAPGDGDRHQYVQTYACMRPVVEFCTMIGFNDGTIRSSNAVYFKEANSNKFCTLRYCYVDFSADTREGGVTIENRTGDNSDSENIHNNVILSRNYHAVKMNCYNEANVFNNTLVAPSGYRGNAVYFFREGGEPVRQNFYNNILFRSAQSANDVVFSNYSKAGTVDYNLYDSEPLIKIDSLDQSGFAGLSAWQSSGFGKDTHSKMVADPLFVGTGVDAERFRLQASSLGKSIGANETEIGAWSGASQIGCSFQGENVEAAPRAPTIIQVD